MPQRTAEASWKGDLRSGAGNMVLGSGAFHGTYSFESRFGDAAGTNPEELIAAAHAGCYSMATASALSRAGHIPQRVTTKATVHIDKVESGFKIQRIDLDMDAEVDGIDEDAFMKVAEETKKTCIVSQALAAVPDIRLKARLRQKTA